MLIPTHIKVGKTRYTVVQRPYDSFGSHGYVLYPPHSRIVVYKRVIDGPRFTPAERRATFWHELTHAVLDAHAAKDPLFAQLRDNENFVERFSKTLSKAIDSAEF